MTSRPPGAAPPAPGNRTPKTMSMKFAYWSPILSGGYVISTLPQRTEWSLESNVRLAQTAERVGFEYTLLPARFTSMEAGDGQNDVLVSSAYLAAATLTLKIIGAFHTAFWHPALIAKSAATLSVASGGRYALNILSGWLKAEYDQFGIPWDEHDERYRKSEEFIEILRGLWTADEPYRFHGAHHRIDGAYFRPQPRPLPEIFQGGNSKAARRMAARHSDWYFLNGTSPEGARAQIEEIQALARQYGREGQVRYGLNGFVILRDTEEAAQAQKRAIIDAADKEKVAAFAGQAKNAGAATAENVGMWSDSRFEDLVQPNDGFKTGLIGPADLIVERIRLYREAGVDLLLTGFLHFNDELEQFGREIIARVRREESRVRVAAPGTLAEAQNPEALAR